jgi:hypothetical protein
MPEYLIGIALSALLGGFTFTLKKLDSVESDVLKLELKISETYVTKEELNRTIDGLFKTLGRMEEKLDAHVFDDQRKITQLKCHYND